MPVFTPDLGINVTPNPGVTFAAMAPSAGIGTISNAGAGSGAITGVGTVFPTQFLVGDLIVAASETQQVLEIIDNVTMITTPFAAALSSASFQINTPAQIQWQISNNGALTGSGGVVLNTAPTRTFNNGTYGANSTTAVFSASSIVTGSGSSTNSAVVGNADVARTNTAPSAVTATGVAGVLNINDLNTQNWPGLIGAFNPAGTRGSVFAGNAATGTIARVSGVSATVSTSDSAGLSFTKAFGYSLVRVSAANLTNGVGAGFYNVGGTNRAYVVLSPTAFAAPTGNWAIYDETGYDTRFSGAVKIGSGSTTVIDANAILYQYGVALPKNNNGATAAPAVTDDTAAGYSVGSAWFWPATGRIWRLRSATTGAAQWVEQALAEQPGYISGNWYMAPDITVAAGIPAAADTVQFVPLQIASRATLSSLGVRITTAEHGGSMQLALYANNPATGRPTGNAVATTASISTASTGTVSAAIAGGSVTLEPGLYWACFNLDATAGGLVAVQVPSTASHPTAALIGSATQANLGASANDDLVSLAVSQTFGTWPNLSAATFAEGSDPARNGPAIHFRIA